VFTARAILITIVTALPVHAETVEGLVVPLGAGEVVRIQVDTSRSPDSVAATATRTTPSKAPTRSW
jgi:hypothetical protein